MREALFEGSIRLILHNQADSGAYLASPGFAPYRYAWLRDGTFTAYAMNRAGRHESASRFYRWCDRTIRRHADKARQAIAQAREQKMDRQGLRSLLLHARYTVEGEEVGGEWGSSQLDGFGTWLWGLTEHIRLSGENGLLEQCSTSIALTLDYLEACWQLPTFDCWEEAGDQVHPSTLSAIYGGVKAMEPLLPERAEALGRLAEQIRKYISQHGVEQGRFVKSIGNPAVDASLLWLALPFGVVEPGDQVMVRTVQQIEQELVTGHGVHRYAADTYYGGGEWPLLSAWLGWYYARTGSADKAREIMQWIESQALPEGLPEQVADHLLAPDCYAQWLEREGPSAVPLLWSHAMYLVLAAELEKAGE